MRRTRVALVVFAVLGLAAPVVAQQVTGPLTLFANANSASPPTPLAGTMSQITGADAAAPRYEVVAIGNNGSITFRRANGSLANPTAVIADDQLGGQAYTGYATSWLTASRGRFACFGAETWGASAQGAYCALATTTIGTTALTNRWKWADTGDYVPWVDNTYNMGSASLRIAAAYVYKVNYKPLTVATLPTSPADGDEAYVTDADACTFNSAVAHTSGAIHCKVHYDGSSSSWKAG